MAEPKVRTVINRAALDHLVATAGMDVAQEAAERVEARARATAPVETGAYRDGLTTKRAEGPHGPEVRVGSTVRHAGFVEADTGNVVRAIAAAKG